MPNRAELDKNMLACLKNIYNSLPKSLRFALTGGEQGPSAVVWFIISLFFVLLSCSAITLLVFVLLAASVAALKLKTDSFRPSLSPVAGLMATLLLLFALAAFISSVLINGATFSSSGYGRIIIWLACFFAGIFFSTLVPSHSYKFLKVMIFVLPCTFVLPITLNTLGVTNFSIYTDGQLSLFTAHPSRLAVICVFALTYASSFLLRNPIRKNKLFLLCAFIILVMLLMTVSRAIIIIFLLAIILTTLFTAPAKLKKILPAAILGLALVAGIFVCFAPAKQTQRLVKAIVSPQQTETFITRLPIWEAGLEAFKSSPVWGHGLKSYRNLYENFVIKNKLEIKANNKYFETTNWHPHNIVLGRLVDTGLAGTIPFFAFYFLAIMYSLKLPPPARWTGAFLIFYFLIGMVDDPLARLNDSFIILLAGLVAGLMRPKNSLGVTTAANEGTKKVNI